MLVKICGITNLEDALVAADAGADYLGFIFYPPSKRSITLEAAKSIVAQLRQLDRCPVLVGVFVNETDGFMVQVLAACDLDLAQLSGDEVPKLVGDPQSAIYGSCYKAIKPSSVEEAEAEAEWFSNSQQSTVNSQQSTKSSPRSPIPDPRSLIPSLLIDAYHPTLHGGTGEVGDWAIAARLVESNKRLMLAGGLTPDNVAEAVGQIRPFAVDVASGVEAAAGKKDHDKVRRFIANAKGEQ